MGVMPAHRSDLMVSDKFENHAFVPFCKIDDFLHSIIFEPFLTPVSKVFRSKAFNAVGSSNLWGTCESERLFEGLKWWKAQNALHQAGQLVSKTHPGVHPQCADRSIQTMRLWNHAQLGKPFKGGLNASSSPGGWRYIKNNGIIESTTTSHRSNLVSC